jgi:hypothetical protein
VAWRVPGCLSSRLRSAEGDHGEGCRQHRGLLLMRVLTGETSCPPAACLAFGNSVQDACDAAVTAL